VHPRVRHGQARSEIMRAYSAGRRARKVREGEQAALAVLRGGGGGWGEKFRSGR